MRTHAWSAAFWVRMQEGASRRADSAKRKPAWPEAIPPARPLREVPSKEVRSAKKGRDKTPTLAGGMRTHARSAAFWVRMQEGASRRADSAKRKLAWPEAIPPARPLREVPSKEARSAKKGRDKTPTLAGGMRTHARSAAFWVRMQEGASRRAHSAERKPAWPEAIPPARPLREVPSEEVRSAKKGRDQCPSQGLE
jgi:hypothetical protein